MSKLMPLLIFILLFLWGCTHRAPIVRESRISALPSEWQVREVSALLGTCGGSREMTPGSFWSFCEGVEHAAHGELRIYNQQRELLVRRVIRSRDRLALAASVSPDSHFERSEEFIVVGTQDGRLLVFSQTGELRLNLSLASFGWVKPLSCDQSGCLVMNERHREVTLNKLNTDFELTHSWRVPAVEHQAYYNLVDGLHFLTTDLGKVYQLNSELQLLSQWDLAHKHLGRPLISGDYIWVGTYQGELLRMGLKTQEFWKRKLSRFSITEAPIKVEAGVWVALDEEVTMKLIDEHGLTRKSVTLPPTRTLTSFEAINYFGQTLLTATSSSHFILFDSLGKELVHLSSPLQKMQRGVSRVDEKLWVGEKMSPMRWEIIPKNVEGTLTVERAPAGLSR